jgi:purine-binding chemotaxis protein CheW
MNSETQAELLLICRAGGLRCALPVEHVIETMRPLPLEALPDAPEFVAGISIVRGVPVPVVPMRRLMDEPEEPPQRLVVVRTGGRQVALAFDEVSGFHRAQRGELQDLPPLLAFASARAVGQIMTLDGALLVVLETIGLVPDGVYAALDADPVPS